MTARDRRILILGAGVIVALIAIAKGIPATVAWQRDKELASVHASELLAASSIEPVDLRAARDSLAARQARLAAIDSVLSRSTSTSAAVAQLASTLEELSDSCAVRVTSVQLRPDSVVSSGLVEVSARLNGVADVAGLAALVRAIAEYRAPLVVRELTVTAGEPTAPSSKAEMLRFDLLVAGLSRNVTPASR